jgi:hypothetical protein
MKRQILERIIYLMLFIFALFIYSADAQISYPKNLWKGLIAEDVAGGYQGMYAVACCVRNRLNAGMNTGLVALKRKNLDEFVRKEGRKVEFIAKSIVREVFEENGIDTTEGACFYENITAFGMPKWAYSMVKTVKIGEHTFFKAR